MGAFAELSTWLNAVLVAYVGTNTARVAAAIEPTVVTLGVLYVMVWGYLQLTGRIDEPFQHGLRRIVTLAIVLGVALRLWLYNSVIVDTVFEAPGQLAALLVGAYDPIGIVDQIMFAGSDAATALYAKGGLLDGLSYYLADSASRNIV
jgi:type IV secretion system protein VirB6